MRDAPGGGRAVKDHDARASAGAILDVLEQFVEVDEGVVVSRDEHEVAVAWRVDPALALIEVGLAVGFELVDGPAFGGVCAEEDGVVGEAVEVGVEVGDGGGGVEGVEAIVCGVLWVCGECADGRVVAAGEGEEGEEDEECAGHDGGHDGESRPGELCGGVGGEERGSGEVNVPRHKGRCLMTAIAARRVSSGVLPREGRESSMRVSMASARACAARRSVRRFQR